MRNSPGSNGQMDRIVKEATALATGPYLWPLCVAVAVVLIIALLAGWWFLLVGLILIVAALYLLAANRVSSTGVTVPAAPSASTGIDLSKFQGKYLGYVQKAVNVSQGIESAIADTGEPGLRNALTDSTRDLSELVQTITALSAKAQSVETALTGSGSMEALSADVMRLDTAMKSTGDQFQRDQYSAALDGKLQQLQNFTDTRVALERWNAQIDNALSALDTIFSQVLRIKSSEVLSHSSATDELSRNLRTQVEVLKATSDAFDSVYGSS